MSEDGLPCNLNLSPIRNKDEEQIETEEDTNIKKMRHDGSLDQKDDDKEIGERQNNQTSSSNDKNVNMPLVDAATVKETCLDEFSCSDYAPQSLDTSLTDVFSSPTLNEIIASETSIIQSNTSQILKDLEDKNKSHIKYNCPTEQAGYVKTLDSALRKQESPVILQHTDGKYLVVVVSKCSEIFSLPGRKNYPLNCKYMFPKYCRNPTIAKNTRCSENANYSC